MKKHSITVLSVTVAALVAGIVSFAPNASATTATVANPQCATQMKPIPKAVPAPAPAAAAAKK